MEFEARAMALSVQDCILKHCCFFLSSLRTHPWWTRVWENCTRIAVSQMVNIEQDVQNLVVLVAPPAL